MNGQSVRLKAALTSGETLINMYELFNGKDTMTIEDAVQDASITLDLSAKKSTIAMNSTLFLEHTR